MENLLLKFQKKAEKGQNKIVIPKVCISKWGYDYFLEVYDSYIKLIPINKEK